MTKDDDLDALLPQTVAGRLEYASNLLRGLPIVDDDGRPTGEYGPPLITVDRYLRLIREIEARAIGVYPASDAESAGGSR